MRIKILPSAVKDLAHGRRFYEKQSPGLGNYFADSLFSLARGMRSIFHRAAFDLVDFCFLKALC
jgi:hypothetical protein